MRVLTQTKRDAILDIASQAFIELGYERASMADISQRVGGSKATLYRYFPSKKELFLEVAQSAGQRHIGSAFEELSQSTDELGAALRSFGAKYLAFLLRPESVATQRMVIAESGQSDIGLRFYEVSKRVGREFIAGFLSASVERGHLRSADPAVMADHLLALLQAELVQRFLFGVMQDITPEQIQQVVDRAIDVFLRAYSART